MAIRVYFKQGNLTNFREVAPINLLGESVRLFLKAGGRFYFKVVEAGPEYITGFDDEGLNLTIAVEDIDYVLGG
jgi:hypothetical protein